jgi:hypothetical protein
MGMSMDAALGIPGGDKSMDMRIRGGKIYL